jgi:hypothetical protein
MLSRLKIAAKIHAREYIVISLRDMGQIDVMMAWHNLAIRMYRRLRSPVLIAH